MTPSRTALVVVTAVLSGSRVVGALAPSRRGFLQTAGAVAVGPAAVRAEGTSLADKLAARDASQLRKPLFNVPPGELSFPAWFEGEWDCTMRFRGYQFPQLATVSREEIVKDVAIAGFQKLSIAHVPDVGREKTDFVARWNRRGGKVVEDRKLNLGNVIDAVLGYRAVNDVRYDGAREPNRCSVVFEQGRTRNAERIELFTNARASESVDDGLFLCSEYFRQVTFSPSTLSSVARQAVTEYQAFWTHRRDGDTIRSNLLTAAYLEPQDPLFFKAVDQPVAVYSHDLLYRRRDTTKAAAAAGGAD